MTTQKPNITQEMKDAAKTVFKAMAFTETIRPIVEGYQKRILEELKPRVSGRWPEGGTIITDIKLDYLMDDADFKVYLKRCNEERIKSGLVVESDEYCPLLVAEDLQTKAERAFLEIMEPITHLTPDQILCSKDGLTTYEKVLDLSLRLLAPYVDSKLPQI